MALETTTNLDQQTLEKLQELIQVNVDSVKGFREAAEQVDDVRIAQLFRTLASERGTLCDELKRSVTISGEVPEAEGSTLAKLHRTWLDLRSKLSGGDPKVILVEAERGEDHIKHAYEDAMKATAGNPLNSMLLEQYRIVKRGHDEVRELRDIYKKSA